MIPFIDMYLRNAAANTTKAKPFKYSLSQFGMWIFIFASLPDETIKNIAEHLTEYFTKNDVAIYSFATMLRAISTTHGSLILPIIYPKLKSL